MQCRSGRTHVAFSSCIMSIVLIMYKASIVYIPISCKTRWGATFPSCGLELPLRLLDLGTDAHVLPALYGMIYRRIAGQSTRCTSMAWPGVTMGLSFFELLVWKCSRDWHVLSRKAVCVYVSLCVSVWGVRPLTFIGIPWSTQDSPG